MASVIFNDGNRSIAPVPALLQTSKASEHPVNAAIAVEIPARSLFRLTAPDDHPIVYGFTATADEVPSVFGLRILAGQHHDLATDRAMGRFLHIPAVSGATANDVARLFIW